MDVRKRVFLCSTLYRLSQDPEMAKRMCVKDNSYIKSTKRNGAK